MRGNRRRNLPEDRSGTVQLTETRNRPIDAAEGRSGLPRNSLVRPDSPAEGEGFEPSVPRSRDYPFDFSFQIRGC
jgi:hypothetical protein